MIIKEFEKISSTNEAAKKLKPKPWTVILAKEQTAGYGQEKRKWYSPRGGLYFTIVLPKLKIDNLKILTLLTAFSVAKVIKENFKLEPFIKLPNDVYLHQKKVAGILVENIIGEKTLFSIAGVGLNTNINKFPEDLKKIATSIRIELGQTINNRKMLKKIINELKSQVEIIKK